MYGELETARYSYHSKLLQRQNSEISLLAPRDEPTGQSLMFIERTVRELTIFEGSTQCERTIVGVTQHVPSTHV